MSAEKVKKSATDRRFVGWQETPIHQCSFGKTTKGGEINQTLKIKRSTGAVQTVSKTWYLLDASKVPVGRLATVAASILSGKHSPTFTPGAGSGDNIVVINAGKAFFTSDKSDKKIYYWHTGWMGGLKMETAREALVKHPEKVIYDAVYGMLPKTNLSQKQLKHLKIYKDAKHPHVAQAPVEIDLKTTSLKNIMPTQEVANG